MAGACLALCLARLPVYGQTPPVPEEDLPPLGSGPSVQGTGALGDYSMMRDASGTSWQPESTPMEGIHGLLGDWSTMVHGYISAIYDHQGGPRGDDKSFSSSMLMGMAQRPLGTGHLMLRGMISLDPLMGKSGYPLLLQTGETADGVTPLVDRQHPHDFFMELAGIYSAPIADTTSAFLYLGYPGEPALGPPAFMHRFSAMDDPRGAHRSSLAGCDPHHLWCRDGRTRLQQLEIRGIDLQWSRARPAALGFRSPAARFGVRAPELESHRGVGAAGQLWLHQIAGAIGTRNQPASSNRVGDL
jgi:hypothetical protein